MSIKFTDAAKYFKGTKEQIEAFEYLQKNTSPDVFEFFRHMKLLRLSEKVFKLFLSIVSPKLSETR